MTAIAYLGRYTSFDLLTLNAMEDGVLFRLADATSDLIRAEMSHPRATARRRLADPTPVSIAACVGVAVELVKLNANGSGELRVGHRVAVDQLVALQTLLEAGVTVDVATNRIVWGERLRLDD